MGFFTTLSDAFFSVCSAVAMTVTTVTDWVAFILHINYTVVTTIFATFCDILSFGFTILDHVLQMIFIVLAHIADFLCEIYACLCALLFLVWRILVLCYKIFCFLHAGIETVVLGIWNGGIITYQTLQQSAADVLETCESTTHYLALLAHDLIVYVCHVFTTIGNFATAVVRGIWMGIGYVPAALASFPGYVAGCLRSIWMRVTMWMSYTFLGVTRETYLGVVVCCLLYILVSRLMYVMHARGMTLFSWRRSNITSQPHHRNNLGLDRGFESDADENEGGGDDESAADDGDSDDDDSVAHTELTLSDNDDSDGHSGGSESDVSLNSQTFSSEESDHEIDVQLPVDTERYSLRSHSSTPSRLGQKDLTHEQFEQELERERDKRKCVVCQDANKSVLILPCKHMCLCVPCANQIVRSHYIERRVCPLCRGRIERVMDVYV